MLYMVDDEFTCISGWWSCWIGISSLLRDSSAMPIWVSANPHRILMEWDICQKRESIILKYWGEKGMIIIIQLIKTFDSAFFQTRIEILAIKGEEKKTESEESREGCDERDKRKVHYKTILPNYKSENWFQLTRTKATSRMQIFASNVRGSMVKPDIFLGQSTRNTWQGVNGGYSSP